MFNKKTVDLYHSITPSSELKENIMQMYAEHNKPSIYKIVKPVVGIAACFIVFISAFVLYLSNNTFATISYEGEKVSKSPIVVTLKGIPYNSSSKKISMFKVDEATNNCIPLDIDIDSKTEISVSNGTILIYNDEINNVLNCGQNFIINSNSIIYWSIDNSSKTDTQMLNLVTNKKTISLSLTYDKANEVWMLVNLNK